MAPPSRPPTFAKSAKLLFNCSVYYSVSGNSFVPGKPRLWSDQRILYTGGTPNLDLAPDGKRFVVFVEPESGGEAKGPVRVTMMLNFFDELRRRVP